MLLTIRLSTALYTIICLAKVIDMKMESNDFIEAWKECNKKCLGRFSTLDKLKEAFPIASLYDWAIVDPVGKGEVAYSWDGDKFIIFSEYNKRKVIKR